MSGPALHITGLCHAYDDAPALRDVSLDVGADELLVVLGPSGAGKTTLLRAVAGLERPTAGRIEMHGDDVAGWEPAQRDVAFVFQNFSLYPGWSVRRNLAFPLQAPSREPIDVEERVAWAARLLRIEGLLERPAEHLSGGEMQRVAIGRAIVRRPRLFLMDEPLTNLDAKLREELRAELVLLRRELRIPMLYVTHDQAEALSMGDRIAVLSEGRVLQVDEPERVYRHPVSLQVARLLGQPAINLLPLCRDGEGGWRLDGDQPGPCLAVRPSVDAGERLWCGVRPEAVRPEGGSIEGVVELVELTGPEQILVVRWAGQRLHLLVDRSRSWHPGQRLAPSFDGASATFWPRQ